MSGNEKASVTKEQNERHRKILDALMKQPENRECADCKSKGPRWASVNLGVFLCIQCSGMHRSLGVHISKVRSATLDTWLPEQVEFIQSMGNAKANAYWEAELPEGFRRPPESDRSGLEAFIRSKYEQRRWVRLTPEERSRMKASLREPNREEEYRSRDRYERPAPNGPPRRPYDPDYDRDWSHGAHANYNSGGSGHARERKEERYDRYERRDRYDDRYGGRDDRDRGGRYDGYGDSSRGPAPYDARDRGGGYREREEPRGAPKADLREQRTAASAPEPGRPAPAPRTAPVLTVPLPGGAAAAATPAAVAAAPTPAPAAPAPAHPEVNKTVDLFDLLNVNDPPAPPVPASSAPATASAAAWAAFPDAGQAATGAGSVGALGSPGQQGGAGMSLAPAAATAAAAQGPGLGLPPSSPSKDKSDILSLFDTTPMSGPFLLAQQQQQMAAALYVQQQYMAGGGGGVPPMGSPTSQASAAGASPGGLGVLAGLTAPGPVAAGADTAVPLPAPAIPLYSPGAVGTMPFAAPGMMMPMGMYGALPQAYPGMQYGALPYSAHQATMHAPLDGLGAGMAYPPNLTPQAPAASGQAPSTGATFDFSSLTADALRK